MPFIKQKHRDLIHKFGLAGLVEIEPGDRCYVFYKQMVEKWKAEPRWTTVHELFKQHVICFSMNMDDDAAAKLAWQVFFHLHVMPYELKKREENGDV